MSNNYKVLLYESSEYDCCGPRFSVGEYIWWQASNFKDKIIVNKNKSKSCIRLDFLCTNCYFKGEMMISAKIKKIEVLKYVNNDEYKFIKKCKNTKEIKDMGYNFLVFLEDYEEYYYNNKRDNIDFRANPYLNQKKVKPLFNTLNIIGDTTGLGLTIAKTFRENHFSVNLFDKTFKKLNEAKENLRYIKSYSNYDSYKIEALENYLISEKLRNSFVIVISNNDNYEKNIKN